LSVAVGLIKATAARVALQAAPALTVLFAGQSVIIGGTFSVIVMTCVQVIEFKLASETVKTTVVLPTGKVAGALLVIVKAVGVVQLSVANGLIKATAAKVVLQAAPALTVLFAGQSVIIGGTFSIIIMT
jgi:hypothetical protein